MPRKSQNKTRNKIAQAAWKLFNEYGYEETTVEDILEESGTSRGSFYHYYEGKEALIASMIFVIDEEYERIYKRLNQDLNCFEKLIYLNSEMCRFIENQFSPDLTSRMFGSQLSIRGAKSLLNKSRTYFMILRRILDEGQANGEISRMYTTNEIANNYTMLERGIIYDWCLCNGEYNLTPYARQVMPLLLQTFFNVPCNIDFAKEY